MEYHVHIRECEGDGNDGVAPHVEREFMKIEALSVEFIVDFWPFLLPQKKKKIIFFFYFANKKSLIFSTKYTTC